MKIKSVCGYCGVGCGIEFDETRLIGDVGYPINEGALCAKGVSELQSIQTSSRLLRPYVRNTINEDFKEIDWDVALGILANKISNVLSCHFKHVICMHSLVSLFINTCISKVAVFHQII